MLSAHAAWRRGTVDRRLYEITVEHLLKHASGWDHTSPGESLLTQIYLQRHVSQLL